MPNPNAKYDYALLYDTFNGLAGLSVYSYVKELAGEKFTSEEKTIEYSESSYLSNDIKTVDSMGEKGEYYPYESSVNNQLEQKSVANTPEQKKNADKLLNKLNDDLTELTENPKLDEYPGLKSFMEHRLGFVKAIKNEKADRWAILPDIPGGYGLKGSPDWTDTKDPEHPKTAKEFDDMLTGMKYDELYEVANSRIDTELEIRGKVLSSDQQEDYRQELINQNNKMIEIYKHQMSDENEQKYADFFQNYGSTVKGARGNQQYINELTDQNKALENGWDVTRLKDYLPMRKLSEDCRKAQETFAHFDEPDLKRTKELVKNLTELDPAGRKFRSPAEQDEFELKYQKTMNSLLEEVTKPEVNSALKSINEKVSEANNSYNNAAAQRFRQLRKQATDPTVKVDPEPVKSPLYGLNTDFMDTWKQDSSSITFKRKKAFANSLDPESLKLEGDPRLVEQRKKEIDRTKANDRLSIAVNSLDSNIAAAKDANKVFITHKDYDDAVKAMEDLRKTYTSYNKAVEKHPDNSERQRIAAEEMKKASEEAAKKIQAYLTRKAKDGKLNEKGQRRVNCFKECLKTTEGITRLAGVKTEELNAKKPYVPSKDIDTEVNNIDVFVKRYADEAKAGNKTAIEKTAAEYASECSVKLKELIGENRPLTEAEQDIARESVAAIMIHERHLFNQKSEPTKEEFAQQIKSFASDPAFKAVADVSRDGINKFFSSSTEISSARLLDSFYSEKNKEFTREANTRNEPEMQKEEPEINNQFERKNNIKGF